MTNPGESSTEQVLTPAQEEEERYQQWMKDNPEDPSPQKGVGESGPKIEKFEQLITAFESTYSLAELHAIVDLRPEDAANYPLREAAKEALVPIVELRNYFKEEPSISPEQFAELEEKYMRLSRAVGIIRNNKVEHDRKGGGKG